MFYINPLADKQIESPAGNSLTLIWHSPPYLNPFSIRLRRSHQKQKRASMKTNFFSVISFVLLISLSFVSCVKEASNSVDQDKIHVAYELFYDKNRDGVPILSKRSCSIGGKLIQVNPLIKPIKVQTSIKGYTIIRDNPSIL